jgi:O-antigen/teichoic acid export membrane protein
MLIELIILIGFSFFISAFGTQFSAILQKELKFDLLAKVNITSNFVSLLTAVTLAVLGYGIYSLIAANLVSAILNTSILMYIGFRIHPPKLEFNFPAVKEFLSFGYFQMGEQTINYFNSQFDMILIGRFFGVETLGLYTIAKNLAMRPYQIITPIITKVTMPVMAKTNHDDYLLKDIYLKTITYTSSLNFPVYVALFVLAEPIVMLIYGSRWSEAIIMVQLLSAYTLIRSTGSSAGSLLMAKGKAALAFYWNLALFTIIPVTIYIGSFWGVYGVVYALILQQLILFTPSYKILIARLLPITFGEYFQPIAIPVLLSTLTGLVCYFLLLLSQNYFVQLLSILITGGIIYISLSIFFNNKFITAVKSLI